MTPTCHGCQEPLELLAQVRTYHTSCDPMGRVEMLERALRKAIDFAWTGHGLPDQLRELEAALAHRPAQSKGME